MTKTGFLKTLDKRRFRRWLIILFLGVALPAGFLSFQAYDQLKWEAFYRQRIMAEELIHRINDRLISALNTEESRSFADYGFFVIEGDTEKNVLQLSPLSGYPVESQLPGAIAYFQVDATGELTSPLVGANENLEAFGISPAEQQNRLALEQRVRRILVDNKLVRLESRESSGLVADTEKRDQPEPARSLAPNPRFQDSNESLLEAASEEEIGFGFESLSTRSDDARQRKNSAVGRIQDLDLDDKYDIAEGKAEADSPSLAEFTPELSGQLYRQKRKEQTSVPASPSEVQKQVASSTFGNVRVLTFESEVDPFDFSLLDSGHFVLYRRVWRDGQRYVQGLVLDQVPLIEGLVVQEFARTSLYDMTDLQIAYNGELMSSYNSSARSYSSRSQDLKGTLLHAAALPAPLDGMEMIFSINRLPSGPAGNVVVWTSILLALLLMGGFGMMYRLGSAQIDVARQQQDFVSSVSHELKTPLTSIRMYGEMLKFGWADDEKRQTYYDYIYDESERLSRLIGNVLQMAKMSRGDPTIQVAPTRVGELVDNLLSKISTQTQQAGFQLTKDIVPEVTDKLISVDPDKVIQIFINLVDNGVKFSRKSDQKIINIGAKLHSDGKVVFSVRDFGPGIPKSQLKKIFQLFYRSESELTRETVGTGIGLALVHQLTHAMGGKIDVVNRDPGVEFVMSFATVNED